jgi:hypothetical protein
MCFKVVRKALVAAVLSSSARAAAPYLQAKDRQDRARTRINENKAKWRSQSFCVMHCNHRYCCHSMLALLCIKSAQVSPLPLLLLLLLLLL